MTNEEIKNHLIQAGIKNLKEFGYPDVNEKNILTDEIYSNFFASMLIENKDVKIITNQIISVIDELLNEIKTKKVKTLKTKESHSIGISTNQDNIKRFVEMVISLK
jgi:hypothetical protein